MGVSKSSAMLFGEIFFERQRVRFHLRLAYGHACEWRGLLEPGFACRQAPGEGEMGVRRIPADRLVLDVHDLVVGIEQLDAMAIGIAHIDIHPVARSVPSRAALDGG